ncbi:MAG: hypothetical protein ABIN97_17135 [Ginsengibacter sp.]
MRKNISIQLKAAFLLVVFSLNIIVGFACAVGIDMGFNSTHHHNEEATEASVHVQANGKKHIHHDAAKHYDEQHNDHHKSESEKGNCCNDKVIKFNEVDKSASHSLKAGISPVFSTILFGAFYYSNVFYTSYIDTGIKYFVRSYHPPIPDIRIAIRSFQI